jgi:hypothetical protein
LPDDAVLFQALDAFVYRCGTQVYFLRNFLDGNPGILLQQAEDGQVFGIQQKGISGIFCFGANWHGKQVICPANVHFSAFIAQIICLTWNIILRY